MQTHKSPGAMFACLSRMSESILQDEMIGENVMLCGAVAVMQHLDPHDLLWYLGSNMRTGDINLRMPTGTSRSFGEGLVTSLNNQMLNAFGKVGVAHSMVYMLDYVCRNIKDVKGGNGLKENTGDNYTVLTKDGDPPKALFGKTFGYGKQGGAFTKVHCITSVFGDPSRITCFDFLVINEMPTKQFTGQSEYATPKGNWPNVVGVRTLKNDLTRMSDNGYRSAHQILGDKTRHQLLTHTLLQPRVPWQLALREMTESKVIMSKTRYLLLCQAHITCLLKSKFIRGQCASLLDAVYAYSVSSSPYNIACLVAKYSMRKLSPSQVMPPQVQLDHWLPQRPHCMEGASYISFTAALKRAALKIYCGTMALMQTPDHDKWMLPDPEGNDVLTPIHKHQYHNYQSVPGVLRDPEAVRFTVFRAIDFFQPFCLNPDKTIDVARDIYNVSLPFDIENLTMSSSSLSETKARGFLRGKGTRFLMMLHVPYFYRRFVAMGLPKSSHFTAELEILFPDDAVFRITKRAIDTWSDRTGDGGDNTLIRLMGHVTSRKKGEKLCKGVEARDTVQIDPHGRVTVIPNSTSNLAGGASWVFNAMNKSRPTSASVSRPTSASVSRPTSASVSRTLFSRPPTHFSSSRSISRVNDLPTLRTSAFSLNPRSVRETQTRMSDIVQNMESSSLYNEPSQLQNSLIPVIDLLDLSLFENRSQELQSSATVPSVGGITEQHDNSIREAFVQILANLRKSSNVKFSSHKNASVSESASNSLTMSRTQRSRVLT